MAEKLRYSQICGTKVGPSYKKRRQYSPSKTTVVASILSKCSPSAILIEVPSVVSPPVPPNSSFRRDTPSITRPWLILNVQPGEDFFLTL